MAEISIEDDMTRAKRGISWIKLDDALRGTGCPVCSQIESTERHYLEGLLYEYVLDVGVRKKLHRQHGFCSRHAGLALTAESKLESDGLHIATMFETVVEEHLNLLATQAQLLEDIGKERARRRKKKTVHSHDACKCFVCDFVRESEETTVHNFLYFSNDDEMIGNYVRSKTLICFRHLEMLVRDKVGTQLLRASIQKVHRMRNDLLNFIKKHDYQAAHDYSKDELDSYIDAVNFFSGRMRF